MFAQDNSRKICVKVTRYVHIKMGIVFKENINKINSMKENMFTAMEIYIVVNLRIIKDMVMVNTLRKQVKNIKENGYKINSMMIKENIKINLKRYNKIIEI